MATKTELQNIIATKLPSGSTIPAVDHREVENALVNEMFPTITHDFSTSGGIERDLRYTKIGNQVTVAGRIQNVSTEILGNLIVATIPTGFEGKTAVAFYDGVVGQQTLQNGTIRITANSILLATNIGIGNYVIINTTYTTND
jgi:hypothetical protein